MYVTRLCGLRKWKRHRVHQFKMTICIIKGPLNSRFGSQTGCWFLVFSSRFHRQTKQNPIVVMARKFFVGGNWKCVSLSFTLIFFFYLFIEKKKLINRSCSHAGLTVQLLVLVDLGSCWCFIMNQHDYWLYNMGYYQNHFFLIYIYIFRCVAEWDIWGSEEDCFYIEWSWSSFWGCCG